MKRIIIAFALMISITTLATAQSRVKDKIESAKVAVISNKLNLTEVTAIKFWPVYNAYNDAMMELRKERRTFTQTLTNIEGASDADLDKALNGILVIEEKELALRRKYKAEFLKVLTIRQVAQLFEAEQEFKKMLLQKVSSRMNGEGAGRRRMFGR